MKYTFFWLLVLVSACSPSWEIPQENVSQVLTDYSKENPENQVVFKTSEGTFTVRLYDETPLHKANFIRLVKGGYFDERSFYRLVKGVCIQGGGEGRDLLKYTVPAEFNPNIFHKKGALAMARYSENNVEKRSSPTEFFIVTKGLFYNEEELAKCSPSARDTYLKIGGEMLFDGEYTVFGEVSEGMDVVMKIADTPLRGLEEPVIITKFLCSARKKRL